MKKTHHKPRKCNEFKTAVLGTMALAQRRDPPNRFGGKKKNAAASAGAADKTEKKKVGMTEEVSQVA